MLSHKEGAWAKALEDYKLNQSGINYYRVVGWEYRADKEKREREKNAVA